MITPMTNFFQMLAPKHCATCDQEIEEMADCYMTICNACKGTVYYPLSPALVSSTIAMNV
jgi:hypothetical protein